MASDLIKANPIRQSQCGQKRRWRSKGRAAMAADLIRQTSGKAMHAYPCQFCGGWHIGH